MKIKEQEKQADQKA
jgi:hypothetical protein